MGNICKHPDLGELWCADEKDGLNLRCGGSLYLDCKCGGDLCVCGNFGEVECYGCPDCEDFEGEEFENENPEVGRGPTKSEARP